MSSIAYKSIYRDSLGSNAGKSTLKVYELCESIIRNNRDVLQPFASKYIGLELSSEDGVNRLAAAMAATSIAENFWDIVCPKQVRAKTKKFNKADAFHLSSRRPTDDDSMITTDAHYYEYLDGCFSGHYHYKVVYDAIVKEGDKEVVKRFPMQIVGDRNNFEKWKVWKSSKDGEPIGYLSCFEPGPMNLTTPFLYALEGFTMTSWPKVEYGSTGILTKVTESTDPQDLLDILRYANANPGINVATVVCFIWFLHKKWGSCIDDRQFGRALPFWHNNAGFGGNFPAAACMTAYVLCRAYGSRTPSSDKEKEEFKEFYSSIFMPFFSNFRYRGDKALTFEGVPAVGAFFDLLDYYQECFKKSLRNFDLYFKSFCATSFASTLFLGNSSRTTKGNRFEIGTLTEVSDDGKKTVEVSSSVASLGGYFGFLGTPFLLTPREELNYYVSRYPCDYSIAYPVVDGSYRGACPSSEDSARYELRKEGSPVQPSTINKFGLACRSEHVLERFFNSIKEVNITPFSKPGDTLDKRQNRAGALFELLTNLFLAMTNEDIRWFKTFYPNWNGGSLNSPLVMTKLNHSVVKLTRVRVVPAKHLEADEYRFYTDVTECPALSLGNSSYSDKVNIDSFSADDSLFANGVPCFNVNYSRVIGGLVIRKESSSESGGDKKETTREEQPSLPNVAFLNAVLTTPREKSGSEVPTSSREVATVAEKTELDDWIDEQNSRSVVNRVDENGVSYVVPLVAVSSAIVFVVALFALGAVQALAKFLYKKGIFRSITGRIACLPSLWHFKNKNCKVRTFSGRLMSPLPFYNYLALGGSVIIDGNVIVPTDFDMTKTFSLKAPGSKQPYVVLRYDESSNTYEAVDSSNGRIVGIHPSAQEFLIEAQI